MVPRAKSMYINTKINKKFVLNSQLPTNQILDKKSRSLEQSYFSFIIKVAFFRKMKFVFQISQSPMKIIPKNYSELEI